MPVNLSARSSRACRTAASLVVRRRSKRRASASAARSRQSPRDTIRGLCRLLFILVLASCSPPVRRWRRTTTAGAARHRDRGLPQRDRDPARQGGGARHQQGAGRPAVTIQRSTPSSPAGQLVYIKAGLIVAADNANEVQGVIAHELGHIEGGQSRCRATSAASPRQDRLLSLLAGVAAIAAGAPGAGMAALGAGTQLAQSKSSPSSRAQEGSADAAAVRHLNEAHLRARAWSASSASSSRRNIASPPATARSTLMPGPSDDRRSRRRRSTSRSRKVALVERAASIRPSRRASCGSRPSSPASCTIRRR